MMKIKSLAFNALLCVVLFSSVGQSMSFKKNYKFITTTKFLSKILPKNHINTITGPTTKHWAKIKKAKGGKISRASDQIVMIAKTKFDISFNQDVAFNRLKIEELEKKFWQNADMYYGAEYYLLDLIKGIKSHFKSHEKYDSDPYFVFRVISNGNYLLFALNRRCNAMVSKAVHEAFRKNKKRIDKDCTFSDLDEACDTIINAIEQNLVIDTPIESI